MVVLEKAMTAMKIGTPDIPSSPSTAPVTPKTGQPSSAAATANTSAQRSAQPAGVAVTVSNLARGLDKASRGQAAEVDAKKVATMRAAIQNGTFVVNHEAIADKLLSNAQEMLQGSTN